MPADATAVIVNFNSGDRLERLLDRLQTQVRDLVVVDNASDDGSEVYAADREGVTLILNADNVGFAAAANAAAANATGAWLLFANPDTLPEGDAVHLLTADLPEDVAVVSPAQLDAEGRQRPETGGYDPSLARFAAWAFLPRRVRSGRGPWLAPPFPAADLYPHWVSGTFMAVRRSTFERVHGFDERFFMFQEDADLCRRLRTAGFRIMCRASVGVTHELAQGQPARRSAEAERYVASVSTLFEGGRRKTLGFLLACGFGFRTLLGPDRSSSRRAFAASVRLLRSV